MDELSKVFDVELLLFCKPPTGEPQTPAQKGRYRTQSTTAKSVKSFISKWVKWWYILVINHTNIFKYYKEVKRRKPDVIYERTSYLNFNGRIIAGILGIGHFYEVNGLHYKDNSSNYARIYNLLSRVIEKAVYQRSYCFFVGGLNFVLGIKEGPKAHIIQNGIDVNFLDEFNGVSRELFAPDQKFNIIFVGHAMAHHKVHLIAEAVRKMRYKGRVCIHFVGSNFDRFMDPGFWTDVEIIQHGVLSHDQLVPLLKEMNVGIIPHALSYYSNMKVFLYAAAKLTLVVPNVDNFRRLFSSEEAVFFDNSKPEELPSLLDDIFMNPETYSAIGSNACLKVRQNYTWPAIFGRISNLMCLQ